MKQNSKAIVLAYSGGLDTTYCLAYLGKELGMQVHAVCINTGAFTDAEIQTLEHRALQAGAACFTCLDVRKAYYDTCIRFLIYGNVLKNQTYPLSVSSERSVQAIAIAEYALDKGIRTIAHGSTGAGNDQVRFDLVFTHLIPGVEIITPVRDMRLSREAEMEYLKRHGVDFQFEKALYSVNKGLWGTSVGGVETLRSLGMIPETAWPTPLSKTGSEDIQIEFECGDPVALNGQEFKHPAELIEQLSLLAQPYGIGRDVHVGDTVIGIKGRVAFEAAAPLILIKAHHLLEKHVLSKWQQYWKEQMAVWYGNHLHDGHMLDPVMRDMEAFFTHTQKHVSGKVHISLKPHHFVLNGIESKADLMSAGFGSYGEMNKAWTGEDVKGFTRMLGMQTAIYQHVHHEQD